MLITELNLICYFSPKRKTKFPYMLIIWGISKIIDLISSWKNVNVHSAIRVILAAIRCHSFYLFLHGIYIVCTCTSSRNACEFVKLHTDVISRFSAVGPFSKLFLLSLYFSWNIAGKQENPFNNDSLFCANKNNWAA